jgi:hypothetical protein
MPSIKNGMKKILFFLTSTLVLVTASAQLGGLGGLGDKLKKKLPNISLFEKEHPITTSFSDVKTAGSLGPNDLTIPRYRHMLELQRTPNGGFVLQEGSFAYQAQSYCLKAGTQGPSKGAGYMFAPPMGQAEDPVMSIARNSVNRPEIPQHQIQALLWAIIARAKFEDLQPAYKATATQLLTPRQLAALNRSALDFIPSGALAKLKASVPAPVQAVLDAENNLRQMLTNPSATFAEMEAVAVLAGMPPAGDDIESGRWTLHPDGYYVRYLPSSYMSTRVEIHVPAGSTAIGREFDPATHIAVPAHTGRQRLLQTGRIREGSLVPSGKPQVISFEPAQAGEGTWVKINGENFRAGSKVVFGEVDAMEIRSISETEIYVRVPQNAVTARVKVLSLDAAAYSPMDFVVTPPVFTNVITTSFADVMPDQDYGATYIGWEYWEPREAKRSMLQLQRTPNGGFVMQPGFYSYEAESYLIKAGKPVQSPGGEGYMYAPIKGAGEDVVMTLLRNCVQHPEIEQSKIQSLLSAIIIGTKFEAMTPEQRVTASRLLTPRQLSQLDQIAGGSKPREGTTVIAKEVKTRWTLHPDGYYIRFIPTNATTTKVEIWVQQGSPAPGKEFDPATMVAVPANTAKERILISARPVRWN